MASPDPRSQVLSKEATTRRARKGWSTPVLVGLALLICVGTYAAMPAHAGSSARRSLPHCAHRNHASGTITIADNGYSLSLNPFAPAGMIEQLPMLFDDLFGYNDKAQLYPMMAATIPTVQNGGIRDGGRTVVIHLKHGLRWSDGREITSADVKFGWRMSLDPATGPACVDVCALIRSIQTSDRYTVTLHLSRVTHSLISPSVLYGTGNMPMIWPPRWPGFWNGNPHLAVVQVTSPAFTFVGPRFPTDGPYQAVRLHGRRTVLQPMRYYADMTCGGYVRQLVLTGYNSGTTPSSAGQIAAAVAGEVDVGLSYFTSDIPVLLRHTRSFSLHVKPTFSFEHLALNVDPQYAGRRNPIADRRVRLALALALDKRAVLQGALSLDRKHADDLTAWTPWLNTPTLKQQFADPAIRGQWDPLANHGKGAYVSQTGRGQALRDARRLLSQTRWKHGFTLDFYTTIRLERVRVMAAVASQWRKLGVTTDQHAIGSVQLLYDWNRGGILDHGAFQVALFGQAAAANPDDLANLLESRYVDRQQRVHNEGRNANVSGIHNRVIDRAFEQAASTFQPAVRKRDFYVIQREVNRQAYWIPLYFPPTISTSGRRILGFRPAPFNSGETWNAYNWRVRGSRSH